jgi:hypothetical protein
MATQTAIEQAITIRLIGRCSTLLPQKAPSFHPKNAEPVPTCAKIGGSPHANPQGPCRRETKRSRDRISRGGKVSQTSQRISNHCGRRREVARQTDFPAKALGEQLFVARHLAMTVYNAEKVARHAIALISQPPTSGRLGGFLQNCVANAAL